MIVLDSSFLIGFYNERDAHHAAASTLMDRFLAGTWGKGLLLEYIFLEITTVLMLRRDLSVATRVGRILLEAEELEFVPLLGSVQPNYRNFVEPGRNSPELRRCRDRQRCAKPR